MKHNTRKNILCYRNFFKLYCFFFTNLNVYQNFESEIITNFKQLTIFHFELKLLGRVVSSLQMSPDSNVSLHPNSFFD